MKADLAIETPLKFFIVIVAAFLIIQLIRNLYAQASEGIDDLVLDDNPDEYELVELGDATAGQLASMADSCFNTGSQLPALEKEFGCYIVKGNFVNVNAEQVQTLARNNLTITIPSGANALFVIYDFTTGTVIIRG